MPEFKSVILLEIPNRPGHDQEFDQLQIAEYTFDPGSKEGNEVSVSNLFMKAKTSSQNFNFQALVKERLLNVVANKITISNGTPYKTVKEDVFRVLIVIELKEEGREKIDAIRNYVIYDYNNKVERVSILGKRVVKFK